MGEIIPTHNPSRAWSYLEAGSFRMDFAALEEYFNLRAREEGFLTDKYHVLIKTIDVDNPNKMLNIGTELYRLLEN